MEEIEELGPEMSSKNKKVKLNNEQDSPIEIYQLSEMYDNTLQQFRELLQRVDPEITVELKKYSHHLKAKNLSADDKSDEEPNEKRSEVAQSEESLQGTVSGSDDERTATEVLREGVAPQATKMSPLVPAMLDVAISMLPHIASAATSYYLKSNDVEQQEIKESNYKFMPVQPAPSQHVMPAYPLGQVVQAGIPYNSYQQQNVQGTPNFGPQGYPEAPYPLQVPGSYPGGPYPAPTSYAAPSYSPSSYNVPSSNNQQFRSLQPVPQRPGQGNYPSAYSIQPQSGPQQGMYPVAPVKLHQAFPSQNQPGPVNPQGLQAIPPQQPVQRPFGPLLPRTTFIVPSQHNVVQGQPPPGYSQPSPQQPAKLGQVTPGNQNFPQRSLVNPQSSPQNNPLHKTLQGQPTAVSQNPPQQLGKPLQIPPGPPNIQQGSLVKPQGITQNPSQIPGLGQTRTTPIQGPNQQQATTSTTANPPSTLKILPAPRESPQQAMVPGPTRSTPPGAHHMPGQLPEYMAPVAKNHQEGPSHPQATRSTTANPPSTLKILPATRKSPQQAMVPGPTRSTPPGAHQLPGQLPEYVASVAKNHQEGPSHPQGLPLWSPYQLQPPPGENCPYYQESPTVPMQVQTGYADNKIQTPRSRKARLKKPKSLREKLEGEVLQSLMDLDDHINVILNKLRS